MRTYCFKCPNDCGQKAERTVKNLASIVTPPECYDCDTTMVRDYRAESVYVSPVK